MTLIVEDGTQVTGANSYISAEDATAYHALYGNTDWSTDVDAQEQALIIATQMADATWADRFKSYRLTLAQSLGFPRYGYWDRNKIWRPQGLIPQELKNAVAELALMYMDDPDSMYPQQSRESNLNAERIKIGPVDISNTYQQATDYSPFRKVELLLYPILRPKGPGSTLTR